MIYPNQKLSYDDIQEIRREYAAVISETGKIPWGWFTSQARKYKVSSPAIHLIITGETWKEEVPEK